MSRTRFHHQIGNSKGNYHYDINTYFNLHWTPHFHKNIELIYILDGTLSLNVNGKAEQMQKNDYALILPDQIHSFHTPHTSSIWIAVFSRQFVLPLSAELETKEGAQAIFHPSDSVHQFLLEHLICSISSTAMKAAGFCAACDEYLRQTPTSPKGEKNADLICRVLDYVEEHCHENITLASACEYFGYEYHYFSRILHQNYQIHFPTLVNECRVERAIHALQTTEKSITDIALESGFQSIRNFNHVFARITGSTPKDFIQNGKR